MLSWVPRRRLKYPNILNMTCQHWLGWKFLIFWYSVRCYFINILIIHSNFRIPYINKYIINLSNLIGNLEFPYTSSEICLLLGRKQQQIFIICCWQHHIWNQRTRLPQQNRWNLVSTTILKFWFTLFTIYSYKQQ